MEENEHENEANVINSSSYETEQCNQYEDDNKDNQLNINDTEIEKKSKNKSTKIKVSYICVLDISVIITAILTAIAYVIVRAKYEKNYEIREEPYLKPEILDHKYLKLTFKNKIIFVIGQIHFNDSAGGAIAFDKGYLNNLNKEYKPGYLNLALTSLIYDSKFNKNGAAFEHLNNYLGNIKYSSDQDYSSFYFSILNDGFLNI